MAIDQNNFCWLSYPNGIQKFDGKNFVRISVQPGLPDDKLVRFLQCSNGDLFFSHSLGISKYQINSNSFLSVYNNKLSGKGPDLFIGEDEGIIYFLSDGNITGISHNDNKIVSCTRADIFDSSNAASRVVTFADNIIDHEVAFILNSLIGIWDLKQGKLVYSAARLPDMSPVNLKLKSSTEIWWTSFTNHKALQLYNFATNTNKIISFGGKKDVAISRCIIYPWRDITLLSFNSELFETDPGIQKLRSQIVNFQNEPIAFGSSITRIKEDNFGNLYLQTVTNGIKKIIRNNYPIRYYGSTVSLNNNVLSVLPDKENNRILVGSTNGLMVFDTMQHLIKRIADPVKENIPFAVNTIVKKNNGSYLLFVVSMDRVFLLSHDLTTITSYPIMPDKGGNKPNIDYFGNCLFQDEKRSLTQSQRNIYKTNLLNNSVVEHKVNSAYIMSGIIYKGVVITHANDELIFVDTASFQIIKKIPFKNTGMVRCFAIDQGNNIYIGSNKGIFKIDERGKILMQLSKDNGLPDECIYAMVFDKEGFLWCSTNKGVIKINKSNIILQLKKEDGLQENEFNTSVVATATDGEVFFGGINGVSSFFPASINLFEEKTNILFTKIKINNEELGNDSAIWNIDKLDLPYQKNSLSFDFIAMSNNNPDQYIYQYKMEGVDDQWIQNDGLQTVRYFLSPGNYIFKVYASRFFDKGARPMKEIRITIHPPFWKTWWFFVLIAIILVTVTSYAINRFNNIKYRKKMVELQGEHRVQLERERISRDLHDNIGAYANAVLFNTEQLQKEMGADEKKLLMNDLKFASKDIIASLRETIWALKKNNYSAEDCLLRIKNFIQPLARYYPHIHFKTEGIAPADQQLHYTKALNIVRIVQEAVTNSIKHAGPKTILLQSSAENGKWKLIISDDGKGFDYKTEKDLEAGDGLINMQHRAADSGLYFNIESEAGKHTTVTIIA